MKAEEASIRHIIRKTISEADKGDVVKGIEYTVVKGDKMYAIARSHRVSIHDILAANPQFDKSQLKNWKRGDRPAANDRVGNNNRNPNWIYPGEKLSIKKREEVRAPDVKPEPESKLDTTGKKGILHRVKFKKSYGFDKKRRDYYDYNRNVAGSEGVFGIDVKFSKTMPLNPDSIRSKSLEYVRLDGGMANKHDYNRDRPGEIEKLIGLIDRVGFDKFRVIK
tara:strand:- start:10592 stop:11257 length:666 start_codon:yes stop_codon:yes gene_type:complete